VCNIVPTPGCIVRGRQKIGAKLKAACDKYREFSQDIIQTLNMAEVMAE
jgi:hypothetical protein